MAEAHPLVHTPSLPVPPQLPLASVRFIAVSATIPNIADIAAWLEAPLPGGLRVYGEEMRPCKLRTHVRCAGGLACVFVYVCQCCASCNGILTT